MAMREPYRVSSLNSIFPLLSSSVSTTGFKGSTDVRKYKGGCSASQKKIHTCGHTGMNTSGNMLTKFLEDAFYYWLVVEVVLPDLYRVSEFIQINGIVVMLHVGSL